MDFITDLHIHSHYSLATSSRLTPQYLEYWARLKGIDVIGTGDCIHPGWLAELEESLEQCENGLFRLREGLRLPESKKLKGRGFPDTVYFILTGEISSIYKRDGKVRKVHNICVFPGLESLKRVQSRLDATANIRSDGRPIIGLDSRILLEMVLDSSEIAYIIPAHIWTPWFSVLGSKSGFDSLEECYGDLTAHIFAVETGLSSDPPMNWTCSFLDRFRLVSNSDAHSPEKLGREANLFNTEKSYEGIFNSLKYNRGFLGTIEFFPQQGKYHYDGHRKCGIVWNPLDTVKHDGICPVCGREITKGVMYRVAELSDRNTVPELFKDIRFYSITQLPDLLAEVNRQKSSSSKAVLKEYLRLVNELGPEFRILLNSEIDEIYESGGPYLAESIRRIRAGEVILSEGYDGEFGTVRTFSGEQLSAIDNHNSLFGSVSDDSSSPEHRSSVEFDIDEFKKICESKLGQSSGNMIVDVAIPLTDEQLSGIKHDTTPCLIIAGPGSGKTRILAERIRYLVHEKKIHPENIVALTFSNRAADEMRSRAGEELYSSGLTISTMHAYGLSIIRANSKELNMPADPVILNDDERIRFLADIKAAGSRKNKSILKKISNYKQGMNEDIDPLIVSQYDSRLHENGCIDIDDLISCPVGLLSSSENIRHLYNNRIEYLLVDEFQDINASQYDFIRLLLKDNGCGLFAIGDPDQAIYGFRGADVRFIDRLKDDYQDLKIYHLTRSFRCSDTVLKAAGQILSRRNYLSGAKSDIKIQVRGAQSDKSEADWIASEIERLMGGVRSLSINSGISDGYQTGLGFGDFAVLCRASFMFAPVIEALANHGISYQLIDNDPFYTYEPYKSVISEIRNLYLQSKMNAADTGKDSYHKILKDDGVAGLIIQILEEREVEYDKPGLLRRFGHIKNLDAFFTRISLGRDGDDYMPEHESVAVMTIHAAKGLEFNTVFVPGCEDGIIPFTLFDDSHSSPDEEERIFYVALTRVSERLFLSYADKRGFRGRVLNFVKSRYLHRIEDELVESEKREIKTDKIDDGQLKLF